MKKLFSITVFIFLFAYNSLAISNDYNIKEGNEDAKIKIFIFESLTCPHCANFHKDIYPQLKTDYIDTGIAQIFFKNFPLDLSGLNAGKITLCINENKRLSFLNHLFENQEEWTKGGKIEDINNNLKKMVKSFGINNINLDECLKDEKIENLILNERINAVKKYNIESTPTIVINEKKFDKPIEYKNLKKAIEKLI